MLRVFNDLESLSRAAATKFIQIANESATQRGRFLVALNGGGTPKRLFQLLASAPDKMDWARARVFWGDERLVPATDPESCYGMAKEILLDRVPIPADNIHRVLSDLKPAEAASDYARVLKRFASPPLDWPRFDLLLLGMGGDGHTASLFPGSPVDATEPVLAVTAHYQGRPARRVTLTPPVFNSAREVMFLAAGASKAEALKHVLNGENPLQYPAARIHPAEGNLMWFVDDAAASALTPGPVSDRPTGRGEN
ncbi:MAG: 6-phosphogluconolactonase [Chloroflexota bacterium]